MKKKMKRLAGSFLAAMMVVLAMTGLGARAATVVSGEPVTVYTIASSGRVTTYQSVNGAYSGYIDCAADQCQILEIYDSGWCKVRYPVPGGTKDAYTQTGNFFTDVNFRTNTITLGSNRNVYRRSDLAQKLGTVYGSDNIIVVGQQNGNTQIIYPLDNGGYKCGWVQGSFGEGSAELADGWYQIKSAIDTNYVIDVEEGSESNCANVILYQNKGVLNQGFLIKRQSDGYYTITALHSNLVLDVEGDGKNSGANVIQYQLNGSGSDNQLWKPYKTSDGYYRFQSKSSGLYLDVTGAVAENCVNIEIWEGNDSAAQKFVLAGCSIDGKTYSETTGSSSDQKIQEIVNYELSQIGVGDYRGNNNVIYNTWYWGPGTSGSGYAWCQAFQSYAAKECGVLDSAIPKTASCATAVNWYRQRGQFHLSQYYGGNYVPKAGDLVFYGPNGGSHVGMITADPVNGYLQVVEGNVYSSKTGNYEVVHFTKNAKRTLSNSYVYGYASPAY